MESSEIIIEDPLFKRIESMIDEVMKDLTAIHSGVYFEPDKARKTAALALQIQILMSKFLASKEADGKAAKLDIESAEAEEYFNAIDPSAKKPSDAFLERAIAKTSKVKDARLAHIIAEKEFRQWYFLQSAMKEAHIYFRAIGNEKTQF